MELKPGYKQTEVGVIPEEWAVRPVGLMGEVVTGKALAVNAPGQLRPYLRTKNVFDGRIQIDDVLQMPMTDAQFEQFRLTNGDVLLNEGQSLELVGRCALYKDEYEEPCAIQNQLLRFRAHPGVSAVFASHLFRYCQQSGIFARVALQTTSIAHLGGKRFEQLLLQFPPFPEQRAIAAALSDVDALITALDQLIAKKRDLKQAAMQQLLTGKQRLPVFHDDWPIQTIEQLEKAKLIKLSRGRVISKKDIEQFSGDFPIYSSSVHNDGLFGRYGDFMFDEELITWSVDGGGDFFHRPKHKFSVTNVCGFMRVDTSKISYRFLAAQLQLLHSRKNFDYLLKAHPSVIRKAYDVPLPTLNEQVVIAEVLSDIDAELTALEQRRDKTFALKQGMMQELLTREDSPRMSTVGQVEKQTQSRVVRLFHDALGCDYLGSWIDRPNNRNVEEHFLRQFLQKQGYSTTLIDRAIFEFTKVASDQARSLYDVNKAVYGLLRYGVKVREAVGELHQTVWLIDWENPEANHFAVAEEVAVEGADAKANAKRPDIVLYVNGIALGVLELKRSTVSMSEGIRQNLDNQKSIFIERFFTTVQLVMAGNDTQGVRYGVIGTTEKHYLAWKEASTIENLLDRHLSQLCEKHRFLELIHDFIVFDAGTKKPPRHNQYFAVRAAQDSVRRHEGGIIWHAQGSGKSLIMVWLAKWLRENLSDARVLIITDRTELDEQIEKVFKGVDEQIYRTKSGADLIASLNDASPWLLCSLIHKFGGKEEGEEVGDIPGFIDEVKRALPPGFNPKGNLAVFVDECHRTQSGVLHDAMKAILPNALFIGFTGTPLLKADKKRSIETFGGYIHTYKFDEAVKDGVVLDLRYEARDIDQNITSPAKIDQWFAAKTRGLNDVALTQLKKKWGTMQKVLSSQSRLEKIVADILLDMETKDRLQSGHGNAILVSGSIYQACRLYEMFATHGLDECAIVTSYRPSIASIKGEETGEGLTERLLEYGVYKKMLADWFKQDPDEAVNRIEEFEREVKQKFIEEPGQMKLLIVVDKLLTGFDAPPATYLYIDKQMRDHGLFQAICRVNRLDGDDKPYGYIIDYKDLFQSLQGALADYTSGALDGYDTEDVAGLLSNRLEKARERLEEAREAIKALCEPVEPPKDTPAYLRYFCAADTADKEALKENEPRRVALYKFTSSLIRAYADLASEMLEAGYTPAEIDTIKREADHFEKVRTEVKLASGDYIDLKMYEPAMRHLIDTYIRAEESEKVSAFDDLSLVELLVQRGAEAVDALPESISKNAGTTAETIENNLRRVIIDEQPINPRYYETMSELLDALIKERKQQALTYEAYLAKIVALAREVQHPEEGTQYPSSLHTGALRALYDNTGKDEALAVALDTEIRQIKKDEWRGNRIKEREVRYAIRKLVLDDVLGDQLFELVKNQREY